MKLSPQEQVKPLADAKAFKDTFDFFENHYESVKQKLLSFYNSSNNTFTREDGRIIHAGKLLNPRLDHQRHEFERLVEAYHQSHHSSEIKISANNKVADVKELQVNQKGVYQAASQFNGLEFIDPYGKPENGVQNYCEDPTQGPASALTCTAGTAFRNYGVSVDKDGVVVDRREDGQIGQSENRQINCLSDVMKLLKEKYQQRYQHMPLNQIPKDDNFYGHQFKEGDILAIKAGYVDSTSNNLMILNLMLRDGGEEFKEQIKNALRCCIQRDTEVTLDPRSNSQNPNLITQVYVSALSLGDYSRVEHKELWAPFAKIILEAAYEHTILEGLRNNLDRINKGLNTQPICLTMLGGGVFGNKPEWIRDAMSLAIEKAGKYRIPFDIQLIHYDQISKDYPQAFLDQAVEKARANAQAQIAPVDDRVAGRLDSSFAGLVIAGSRDYLADDTYSAVSPALGAVGYGYGPAGSFGNTGFPPAPPSLQPFGGDRRYLTAYGAGAHLPPIHGRESHQTSAYGGLPRDDGFANVFANQVSSDRGRQPAPLVSALSEYEKTTDIAFIDKFLTSLPFQTVTYCQQDNYVISLQSQQQVNALFEKLRGYEVTSRPSVNTSEHKYQLFLTKDDVDHLKKIDKFFDIADDLVTENKLKARIFYSKYQGEDNYPITFSSYEDAFKFSNFLADNYEVTGKQGNNKYVIQEGDIFKIILTNENFNKIEEVKKIKKAENIISLNKSLAVFDNINFNQIFKAEKTAEFPEDNYVVEFTNIGDAQAYSNKLALYFDVHGKSGNPKYPILDKQKNTYQIVLTEENLNKIKSVLENHDRIRASRPGSPSPAQSRVAFSMAGRGI